MARTRKDQKAASNIGSKIKDTLWRIAIYIRLSREDGNEESESVVNQKRILDEYVATEFDSEYIVHDYYIDDGLTGTDDTRANFMRMIQDVEQDKVNCVICKTLSRAFRNYSDQGYYLEYYFPQKKVRFISTGDPKIDTFKNPEAITGLEVPITGLMNDRYSCRTSNDIRRTFHMKRQRGEFIGAFPPYGFLKDPNNKNRLILDMEIAPIKRDMMDWIVLQGMSLGGVARKLNEMGIPNPSAYKRSKGWKYNNPQIKKNDSLWTGTAVKTVLLNKANIGYMVQGRQRVVSYKVHDRVSTPEDEWYVVENAIEPTFTQEEYDTLVQLLTRDTRRANDKQTVYLLSGFVRCADCNKAMHRRATNRFSDVYYACRTYIEKSKAACTRHSIREDELRQAVFSSLRTQINLLQSLSEVVDKINSAPTVDTHSARIEKMLMDRHKELDKAKSVTDSLYVDWKTGEISREEYQRMKAKFQEQIGQLTAAIQNLEAEQHRIQDGITSENAVFQTFLKYRNIQELDRTVLAQTVDTIFINEGKKITIKFRFSDELERMLELVHANSEVVG